MKSDVSEGLRNQLIWHVTKRLKSADRWLLHIQWELDTQLTFLCIALWTSSNWEVKMHLLPLNKKNELTKKNSANGMMNYFEDWGIKKFK